MKRAPNKTRKVAVYPNGYRYPLRFANGVWWWRRDCGSFPQSAVAGQLREEYGGWIEIEPNPEYERWAKRHPLPVLEGLLRGLLT